MGKSPHTHLHAITPHHQTTPSKHSSTHRRQEFIKISNLKAKCKEKKTYLGGENDEQNWKLDDEIMQDEAQGWQNSVKIWKIWGKNRVGIAWKKKKNKEEEEEGMCACVRGAGKRGFKFFLLVPLKRYVPTALAVRPFFTFFFRK